MRGGQEITTACGLEGHRRGKTGGEGEPYDVTAWSSQVTCADCQANLRHDPQRPGPVTEHRTDCDCHPGSGFFPATVPSDGPKNI